MTLPNGIYEQIINQILSKHIQQASTTAHKLINKDKIDGAESSKILSAYMQEIIRRALGYVTNNDDYTLSKQIEICNKIIQVLKDETTEPSLEEYQIMPDKEMLIEVVDRLQDQIHTYDTKSHSRNPQSLRVLPRPETSISESSLFTGSIKEPSLDSEFKKEILSADRIDILVSFIKWSGLRLILDELQQFTQKNQLRIITTSYMGATDYKAIKELSKLPHTEIKVSYDTKRTRLHAKSYLFHRNSGFTTAYIGSSNLSNAAISNGLEWNIKVTAKDSIDIIRKFEKTFESYWNDPEFTTFQPDSRETKDKLYLALIAERQRKEDEYSIFQFDIEPYSYQKEILDQLTAEREIHHRYKNLIVAATGTGKTVISAFDYKRFKQQNPAKHRLLFVAHREEILKQSLACFRGVLRDQNFGDLWVGQHTPDQLEHLFISIQTFNSKDLTQMLPADYYDYIIVDEFHRAPAPTYQELFTHFRPKILLGLTATPERMDGKEILDYFAGRIAAEIRLPDAINRKLLSPFQYFGVSDSVDLSHVKWSRGGYDISQLDKVYTKNDQRADLIIQALHKYLNSINEAIGLGFCVSVAHAKYMADFFNKRGIPAISLDGNSSPQERNSAKERLVRGEITFIFVVDLYNEGVDIPKVNTILFLRPTESLTVFLQQLGRGLRLAENKECLTVLDFIGQAHNKYSFESKFRAMLGETKHSVKREIENGFPNIPKGCYIQLEKVAQRHILDNIKQTLNNKRNIVRKIASFSEDTGKTLTLQNFVGHYQLKLADIYSKDSWSRLCVDAGVKQNFSCSSEKEISKGLYKLQWMNSIDWIAFLLSVSEQWEQRGHIDIETLSDQERKMLLMFHYTMWGKPLQACEFASLNDSLETIFHSREIRTEIKDLLQYIYDNIHFVEKKVNLGFSSPLRLHCRYSRDQVLSALGYYSEDKMPAQREGVLYLKEEKVDVLLITLNKTEKDYSPSTMYEDYAINDHLFHWQTQNRTSEDSETGQRYINHKKMNSKVVLFVREYRQDENREAVPYYFLGTANYVKHDGDRPMSITWMLDEPIPASLVKKSNKMIIG